jgi:hypothetical protein
MADPMQYTGYTYGSDLYRQPTETLADYMQRLAAQRATGVLGGGGMLDTPPAPITETDPVLGTVTQSCPAGFTLQNGACVRVGGGDTTEEMPQVSAEERYKGMRDLLDNPEKAAMLRALIPFGLGNVLLTDNQIEGYVRNAQNEATKAQGFFDYLGGKDGDVVTGSMDRGFWDKTKEFFGADREAAPKGYEYNPEDNNWTPISGGGSLVTGQPSIVNSMFSQYIGQPFDPSRYTANTNVIGAYNATATPAPSVNNPRAIASSTLSNALWQDAARQGMLSGAGNAAIDSYLSNLPPVAQSNYIQDTGSGVTTSGSYNDSGDWSWSGTDFSAPAITSDGNDWNSW